MAERGDTVSLAIGGQLHEGWTSVEVTRAIDTMAGAFKLELAERWPGQPARFELQAGAACAVMAGGETLITGYIDRLETELAGEDHVLRISGRDKAGDLIDCAAIHKPGSWRDTAIETIAAELVKPFGISVAARAPTGARLKRFALQPGETVQAAIERLCRFRGLLAISDAQGNIVLTSPGRGAAVETLTEGANILACSAEHDTSERFSEYLVKGQASGDDEAHGKTVSQPSAVARDPGMTRHRPLMIVAEEQATLDNLEARAKWEAVTRAGRAQPGRVRIAGWRRPDGQLRAPDTIVTLDAPSMFMAGPMLVESVTLSLGEGGTTSRLSIVPPEAWSQLAVPETAAPSRVGKAKREGGT